MTKTIVLFSGGLDSRIAIKLLQEQGIEVLALNFDLPFGEGCCNSMCSFNFTQTQGLKLKIIDCKSGKLFQEYIKIIKKPKYGYGSGMNPCIDCHIFMLKKAKKFMDEKEYDFISTGEVLGERPMSQHRKALEVIEEESGLKGILLRPLSAKLLHETDAEKKRLIDREKLLDIYGRSRKRQIKLAEKYKIKYPSPGGGCILCEKEFAERLKNLFRIKKKIDYKEIELLRVGRHFLFDKAIIIVGRNQEENGIITGYGKINMEVKDIPSPITTILGKVNDEVLRKASELTIKYSDAGKLKKEKVEVIKLK